MGFFVILLGQKVLWLLCDMTQVMNFCDLSCRTSINTVHVRRSTEYFKFVEKMVTVPLLFFAEVESFSIMYTADPSFDHMDMFNLTACVILRVQITKTQTALVENQNGIHLLLAPIFFALLCFLTLTATSQSLYKHFDPEMLCEKTKTPV